MRRLRKNIPLCNPISHWSSTNCEEFLHQHSFTKGDQDDILEKRDYVQSLLNNFNLLESFGITSEFRLRPAVLPYGSCVAGTAFQHGDADFSIAFPCTEQIDSLIRERISSNLSSKLTQTDIQFDKAAGFLTIRRESQPLILSELFEHLRKEGTLPLNSVDIPQTQRIFRARIPIIQIQRNMTTSNQLPAQEDSTTEKTTLQSDSFTRFFQSRDLDPFSIQKHDTKTRASTPAYNRKSDHVDLSLSLDGCKNSFLIRRYMQENHVVRAATMLLKHWARKQKILNARRGWISPYALTIMFIHFLQNTNVISIFDTDMSATLRSISDAFISDGILDRHTLPAPLLAFPSGDFSGVDELMSGFFHFYSEGRSGKMFDFDEDVVDVRPLPERLSSRAEWNKLLTNEFGVDTSVPRRDDDDAKLKAARTERWHRLGHECILIHDPYEGHSLGRSVEFFRAEAIREEFRLATKQFRPNEKFFSFSF